MTGSMSGEVAIVTGGGRGFGRAIAERFAREGAAVAIVSRSKPQLDAVVEAITHAGGRAMAVQTDVASPEDVRSAVDEVRSAFGPITRLVSNAGVPGPFGPLWVTDPDEWWKSQAIHIRAPYLFLRNVLPEMVERNEGRVVLISAIASLITLPGVSAYSVGKAAQNKLVSMVAEELKDSAVKIFAVEPGFVVTQLAEDTYNSPDAQKYLPHMMEYLEAGRQRPEPDADLHRCAQRCVDLMSGRYDALSGRFMQLPDPIDEWLDDALNSEAAA